MLSFKTGGVVGLGKGRTRGIFFCVEIFILFFQNALTKRKKRNTVSTSANGYSLV